MASLMRIVISTGVILAVSVITNSGCYARLAETKEISVGCSSTEDEAEKNKIMVADERPYTCHFLRTKGLQLREGGEFLDISDIAEEDLKIEAWCTIQAGGETRGVWYHDMLRFRSGTIKCDEGQGIMVTAFKAPDQENSEYQYVAELTTFTRPSPEQYKRMEERQIRKKALEAQNVNKDKKSKEKSKTKTNKVRIHAPPPIYMQPEQTIQPTLELSTSRFSSVVNLNSK